MAILSAMTINRDVARIAAIAVFGLLGIQGSWGAIQQFSHSETLAQHAQTIGLMVYGLSGIGVAMRTILRRRRLLALEFAWSAGVVLATGLAPSAWGGAPLIAGIMSGLAGAAIVLSTLWLVRRGDAATGSSHLSHHDR